MLTFAQFITEAAHPAIKPLKDWDKETPYYTHGKPVYHHTPADQGDRREYEHHHYRIFPKHDDDSGAFKGYETTHVDPRKPYHTPGRNGEDIPYHVKHLGTFPNVADAHRAVKAHHDGDPAPAPRNVKRPEGSALFDTDRMRDSEEDFGFLHGKTGKSIRRKDAQTHGELWARKTEGKGARGSQNHILDALAQGHTRYRFAPDPDKSSHVEANFSLHHDGNEAELQHHKGHIAHMLKHAPYPISRVNVDVFKNHDFNGPQGHSFDDVKKAHGWLRGSE